MAETHVVSALKRKYARLIGEAERHEQEADRIRALAGHIAASIDAFAEGFDVSQIKPVSPAYSRWRGRGIGIRIYLEVLRKADRPLTSLEIAERAIAFDPDGDCSRAGVKALVGPINKALSKKVGCGVVRIEGKPRRWALR
ncbi:hypothetical protein [Novosphingobium beihaiensis]|uniref:HTH domain-containing protein n=1 Tax=Novosphingobium beihaiensis TaxID=2930389 RepID=A0ABT0BQM0_9SPHN|nr:hypothetical protein [Novosphingobium beihaiensis]MCJ2187341.1 hypothetical protein [Novosphingobium beihaiensis]